MCVASWFEVKGHRHTVYMGYYGARFDGRSIQPSPDDYWEGEDMDVVEGMTYVRKQLEGMDKAELIEAFLGLLQNSEDA